MKILELGLAAFGPFTGRSLDLSAGRHGLHVVYGPNEAGKSSALRALRALLFGFPGQTADAFVHPYGALRVAGRVRRSTGEELAFVRNKGRAGTLRSPTDDKLADDALAAYLGAVDGEHFDRFWGIDYARLVLGGEELEAGKGDLADSLFAAGSGVVQLRRLRAQLAEEADALFAPRAKNRLLNAELARWRELRTKVKEQAVSVDDWRNAQAACEASHAAVVSLEEREAAAAAELVRLRRLKRTTPLVAVRRDALERLALVADATLVDAGFAERLREAAEASRAAERAEAAAAAALAEQRAEVERLGAAPALLRDAAQVRGLVEELGQFRKARKDLPAAEARRAAARAAAKKRLAEFRPDADAESVDALRALVGRRTSLQRLAAERTALDAEEARLRKDGAEAAVAAADLAREAPSDRPLPETAALEAALEAARALGDAATAAEQLERDARKAEAGAGQRRRALGVDDGAEVAPDAFRPPSPAFVAAAARRDRELVAEAHRRNGEEKRLRDALGVVEADAAALATGAVRLSEEALAASRRRRDAAFGLIEARARHGRDIAAEARALLGEGEIFDRYPPLVADADLLADRLRREADRVARAAQLEAERARLTAEADRLTADKATHAVLASTLAEEWRRAWEGVPTRAPEPEEAAKFLADVERWREAHDEAQESRRRATAFAERVRRTTDALREALRQAGAEGTLPEGLAGLVGVADGFVKERERESRRRTEHARRSEESRRTVRRFEDAAGEARRRRETWDASFAEAVTGLVAGNAPHPDDALAIVEAVANAVAEFDDAAVEQSRIAGMERDAAAFAGRVRAAAERLGAPPPEAGAEDLWVEATYLRLEEETAAEGRRRAAQDGVAAAERIARAARAASTEAAARLADLRSEARAEPDADLGDIARRSERRRTEEAELRRSEGDLLRAGDGLPLEDLVREAATADTERDEARAVAAEAELTALKSELRDARQREANDRAALRERGGPSIAAEHAEAAQASLAKIRATAATYARLKLAETLLGRRIDDYRRENQTPMLRRAGELFRTMTCGAFVRLEADVDDDRPVLEGVRASGGRVRTDGMSTGTRDQLFLALRLSAVEAAAAASEPLPFVADDVLVQFDDERAGATLTALADVARRTQVIVFTHHDHVAHFAEELYVPAGAFVHRL